MLTGKRAFDGTEVTDVLARVIEREPDWGALPAGTRPAIGRLLRRCLQKDRKQRLQHIGDARIEIDEAQRGPDTEAPRAVVASRDRRSGRIGVALLAMLCVALAVATTWALLREAPESPVWTVDVVTPPTLDPFSFALSPDGRQLALVANTERGAQLWVRALDDVAARPLARTDGAAFPFWSPDSRAIGFFADGKLKRIDLTGGTTRVLADAPIGRGGTWNRDGVIVFASTTTGGLMRVAGTGGAAVPVTRLSTGHGGHRWPQFLPDGRRFLFLVAPGAPDVRGVYLGSLEGGDPTRLTPAETAAAYAVPGYLLLVSQGVLVARRFDVARGTLSDESIPLGQAVGTEFGAFGGAFSTSDTGILAYRSGAAARRQLLWVDRSGKTLGEMGPSDDTALSAPVLSPDGRRVAVVHPPVSRTRGQMASVDRRRHLPALAPRRAGAVLRHAREPDDGGPDPGWVGIRHDRTGSTCSALSHAACDRCECWYRRVHVQSAVRRRVRRSFSAERHDGGHRRGADHARGQLAGAVEEVMGNGGTDLRSAYR